MEDTNIEIAEKMDGITLNITYVKPEEVALIPILPRSSIKLVINGKKIVVSFFKCKVKTIY
ncbi:MAG: hypothetical protein GX297_00695 [Treponema sp.]|jgi:hypothetical protein|nr:hypothetical protein [Treponema sp.]